MSSELTPCPTCGAQLRVPDAAAMIRCPKCKTILSVETVEEPESPAPPPKKSTAPPLPFGRAAAKASLSSAATPSPSKKPRVTSGAAPIRAKLAPVSAEEFEASPKPGESGDDALRRQRMQAALEKMKRQEEREKQRYEEFVDWCRWGRFGLYLLAGGALAYAIAAGVFALFLISLIFWDGYTTLVGLAAIGLVGHFVLTVGGFGCCAAGPPVARMTALTGLGCTLLQLLLAVAATAILSKNVDFNAIHQRSGDPEAFLRSSLFLCGILNNLLTMAILPLFVSMTVTAIGTVFPFKVLMVPILAGIAEFAKVSLMGVLGNRLAVEAKAGELSHLAMRFVHRTFAAVLTAAILFPLSVPLSFLLADALGLGKGGGVVAMLVLPVGAVQNGYFLWWVYTWSAQYQTLKDIAEVVVPNRFVHKGENLDQV